MQMKKILCGMIAAMMLGSLAGCANENSSTGEASVTEILNAESSEAVTTAEADSNAETTAAAEWILRSRATARRCSPLRILMRILRA